MKSQELKIDYRDAKTLIPYARNSRTHSAEQVKQIAQSIAQFGWTNPVLVDDDGGVIAGHGRLLAAEQIGIHRIPCITVLGLTDAQRRALIIADNNLAINAGWDMALLSEELKALDASDLDMSVMGFSAGDLDDILAWKPAKSHKTDPDASPDLPVVSVSALGDIWICGPHRIMCGDSTDVGHMARLMGGGLADMVFTDPPYNVAYSGRGQK